MKTKDLRNGILEMPMGDKEDYGKYTKASMKAQGVDPENLGDESDEKTKKVFKNIDKGWKAKDEKKENIVDERKALRKFVNENIELKEEDKPKIEKKTRKEN